MHAVAGTIAAKGRLAEARVVASSFREHHPDVPFYLLLSDDADGYFEPAREPFELVCLGDLGLGEIRELAFRYDREPLSYALTAVFMRHLLRLGFEHVVFLKQETLVTGDLRPLFDRLATHPIVLTPHLLAPLRGPDAEARELNVLLSGTYNVGVIGVSNGDAGRRFLDWWHDRLRGHSRHAVADGMHFEQRWVDLVPSYFEEASVVRDVGVNVAHWNVRERVPTLGPDGTLRVAGQLCRVFRFSGYVRETPDQLSRYAPTLDVGALGDAAAVVARYREALDAAGHGETSTWPYVFACFENGVPIPPNAREIYAALQDVQAFGDPFRTSPGSFWSWLTEPLARGVTRLWYETHERRPDLQVAFPDPLGPHRRDFVRWIESTGGLEYRVAPELGPPARRRIGPRR
jgi:hypothetical protein